MGTVGKLSVVYIIILFVLYLGLHYALGKYKLKIENENKEKPGNLEREKHLKNVSKLFNWFPAIYLVLMIIILYAS